ncbi:MAG: molecular chaperone TorD family protein [Deltaproteobacteria bacterium]|nr:molecular chaperone TorD family protein [Deltaproteobacteria bacterium]
MTRDEKETFCTIAASLLAPPDESLLTDLEQQGLRAFLTEGLARWGGEPQALTALLGKKGLKRSLSAFTKEYHRLFGPYRGEVVSLVESTYKPWAGDKKCGMLFATSTGLVMGDSAIHLLDVYREASLEVPETFRSTPDHLILELEFLALLYRTGTSEQIQCFITDHLDWIPALKEELALARPKPFYRGAVELIDIFVRNEQKHMKENHGQTTIH